MKCSHSGNLCDEEKFFNSDPRHYNLTEDFIFVDHQWGPMFYKYVGQMKKSVAKQYCSQYGEFVHLPMPRFTDENEFYRDHFGTEAIWLDMTNDVDALKSSSGHLYINYIETASGVVELSKYKWINASFDFAKVSNGITLTKSGYWTSRGESEMIDSVCVYNIVPDDNCSMCFDNAFCRFIDKEKRKSQCVCPEDRSGEYCEKKLCEHCRNGGYCSFKDNKNATCICPYPFEGNNCEICKNFMFYF